MNPERLTVFDEEARFIERDLLMACDESDLISRDQTAKAIIPGAGGEDINPELFVFMTDKTGDVEEFTRNLDGAEMFTNVSAK
jgi:hypothetical protein